MVKTLENRIREIVAASIDAIAERGSCDFVRDLAVPLPMLVIAEMIASARKIARPFITGRTR